MNTPNRPETLADLSKYNEPELSADEMQQIITYFDDRLSKTVGVLGVSGDMIEAPDNTEFARSIATEVSLKPEFLYPEHPPEHIKHSLPTLGENGKIVMAPVRPVGPVVGVYFKGGHKK